MPTIKKRPDFPAIELPYQLHPSELFERAAELPEGVGFLIHCATPRGATAYRFKLYHWRAFQRSRAVRGRLPIEKAQKVLNIYGAISILKYTSTAIWVGSLSIKDKRIVYNPSRWWETEGEPA